MTFTEEFLGWNCAAARCHSTQLLLFERIAKRGNVYKLPTPHFLTPVTTNHTVKRQIQLPTQTHFLNTANGTENQPWKDTGWVVRPSNIWWCGQFTKFWCLNYWHWHTLKNLVKWKEWKTNAAHCTDDFFFLTWFCQHLTKCWYDICHMILV